MKSLRSITTRRGFIAATSFGVVSLYGVWAALGIAPLPWSDDRGGSPDHGDGGHAGAAPVKPTPEAHAGHGGGGADPSSEEFRRLTEEFVARNQLADGSVRPQREGARTNDPHAAHLGMAGMPPAAEVPREGAMSGADPIDVYLMAFQWGYEPSTLLLDARVPYRFRMMAIDASHGASIQLGSASRIIRLRRGALTEQMLSFTSPGEYLVYCTVYCGEAHDRMAGKIIVV